MKGFIVEGGFLVLVVFLKEVFIRDFDDNVVDIGVVERFFGVSFDEFLMLCSDEDVLSLIFVRYICERWK